MFNLFAHKSFQKTMKYNELKVTINARFEVIEQLER